MAYHEGQGGWKKGTHHNKKWLIDVAKNVESTGNKYNNQLKQCESELNNKGVFGIF